MIPYGRQEIVQSDIDAVISVLKSDFLTQGPCVPKFEKKISKYCGAKYAVATNSSTSSLHLACLALGLVKGDWLWTSSITFVASANCALYCGAKVDFVDIDPTTYNLCPKALKNKLIKAKELGILPKIVVPVHLSGQSCDMKAIHELSKEYGFKIIEDASHAVGGSYKEQKIGSCQFSDITVFSFHPVKIITTGEGGIALTNNFELSESMSLLRTHGITRDPKKMTNESDGEWYYQQIKLGFNYRMTDIQAALGMSQLERLDNYISRRHELASRYNNFLKDLPIVIPYQDNSSHSSFHLYIIRLKNEKTHKQVFEYLREKGVIVNLHYIPVHTHPYYQKTKVEFTELKHSEQYYKDAISLPLYPTMTEHQQDLVISTLREALQL